MVTFVLLVAFCMTVAFGYSLFSKLRSRHTIALHRHPEDVRRKPWEPADYSFMGIPITWSETAPKGVVLYTNYQGKQMLYSSKIDWSDVF